MCLPLAETLCVFVCVCVCVCSLCACVRVTYQHNLFLKIRELLPLCKVADSFLCIQEFFPFQCSVGQEIKCKNVCLIDIRMHWIVNCTKYQEKFQKTSTISFWHFFWTSGLWIRRRRIHLRVPVVVSVPAMNKSSMDSNKSSSVI